MVEEICYQKTFIKEVICRIDFQVPIDQLNNVLPKKIKDAAVKLFPILEPNKSKVQEFKISNSDTHIKSSDSIEWNFYNKTRTKRFSIHPTNMIIVVREYNSFEELQHEFKAIAETIFQEYKDLNVSRFGLRYINVININEDNPLEWEKYINEKMLLGINYHQTQGDLTRFMKIIEYTFDDIDLKFQYGIANPDFPAKVKKKEFVLDLDAYATGSLDLPDILGVMTTSHEKIQTLYEESIRDETRELMRPSHVEG